MARRKDHTREELIAMAIAGGRKLVQAGGPESLKARKVAEYMGYAPGTLYNLFGSIDDLSLAINVDSLNQFADMLRRLSAKARTSRGRLRKQAEAYLAFQEAEPHLWSLLFAAPLNGSSQAYACAVESVFKQVEEAMLPFARSATFARQNAKIFWATLHGICLLRVSGKLDVAEADSAERLVSHFLEQFPVEKAV